MRDLGTHYHARAQAAGAAEALMTLLEYPGPAAPSPVQNALAPDSPITLVAEDFTVKSLSGEVLAGPLGFRINAGDHVAVVGPSGSGKTSLLNGILGFLPYEGSLTVNGVELNRLPMDQWRGHLAWLGQEPVLFQGSVRENVALADPSMDDTHVRALLARARVLDVVEQEPLGLAHPVGEQMTGVSVGVAQRIALARARPVQATAERPPGQTAGACRGGAPVKVLWPFVKLFRHQWAMMLLGLALSVVTLGAGIALLSLSGWFLAAAAVAGLIPAAAHAFNYFTPGAAVRLLSLIKTLSRYAERLATHEATFQLLTRLRVWAWGRILPLSAGQMQGLRQGELLNRLVADIDTLDHLYLRLAIPVLAGAATLCALFIFWAALDLELAVLLCASLASVWLILPWAFYRMGRRPGIRQLENRRVMRVRLLEFVQGLAEVSLYGCVGRFREGIVRSEARLLSSQGAMATVAALSQATLVVCHGLVVAGLLFAAADGVGVYQPPGPMLAMIAFMALAHDPHHLAGADPGQMDPHLIRVLDTVGLSALTRLENHLDTWIGEGGRQLSGGERRRIGVARVLLRNAPLLLLDEPTEGLDTDAEREILDLLFDFAKDKTLVMISHRLTAMARMDRILLMENGQIRVSGTHDDLLAKDAYYASLYQRLDL